VESLNDSIERNHQNTITSLEAYILGPGDSVQIEVLDLPELSGVFSIGPDGTLYLPRLRALYVEGLNIEELRFFLNEQFNLYVKNPEIYIRPIKYRPIRVYVSGEVRRPGYYTLSGLQAINEKSETLTVNNNLDQDPINRGFRGSTLSGGTANWALFPTLFDAIRAGQGLTPYSDLSVVEVTRKQSQSNGGGRKRATINFISLLTEGNESQNIRLFDGDIINVGKSDIVNRDQLIMAGQTNISPQFVEVYVSGRVKEPGGEGQAGDRRVILHEEEL